METIVKNSELLPISQQLNLLLTECITLGTKSRIIKIINRLKEPFEVFNPLYIELLKKYGGQSNEAGEIRLPVIDDNKFDEYNREFDELNTENTIQVDPIDFNKIADISSSNVYDFNLLSRFFENYN